MIREDHINLISRLQKALSVNPNPSFTTIAHDCGFQVAEVHLLKKEGFIAKHMDGWRWAGPWKAKDAVDKMIVLRRKQSTLENVTTEHTVGRLLLAGVSIDVHCFHNMPALDVGCMGAVCE